MDQKVTQNTEQARSGLTKMDSRTTSKKTIPKTAHLRLFCSKLCAVK